MSEGEVQRLAKAIEDLSKKTDRQHEENQKQQVKDRETFREALSSQQLAFGNAMAEQRQLFQGAINQQYIEVTKVTTLLRLAIGDGEPGQGRLGALEATVETLKKFRWQTLAALMTLLYLIDKLQPLLKHQ